MIRRSSRDEAETLFAIQRAACVEGLAHIFPPDRYPFPESILDAWRAFDGTVLVAERDGRAVGLAAVRDCWLRNLYVIPEAWGTGVAAELHDAALAELPDCGEVRLWTLERNNRARSFYEKHGWRPNGETRTVEFPPYPRDVGYTLKRETQA